ncbi:peptidase [Rathayibacter sp. AY1B5]|uniref:peptidase n=1 Tax=Rathayibacter sp. AY1B5 TaxID=2080530 RepID=UPI000CE832D5|nr:peptidase [Rathayibacter sp. AY1B5]PPI20746.1 peptidase [Rathayibacter sp. AY1B5]
MSGAHRSTDGTPPPEPQRPPVEHGRHSARPSARDRGAPRHSPDVRRRVVSRAGLTGIIAGALVLGAAATATAVFLDRASVSARVASGTVIASLSGTGATTVPVPVAGLVPGGTARRLLDLTNAGTLPMSALQLQTTTGTDLSDGLQLVIERCTQSWSADAATCPGTVTTVSADRPATSRLDLPGSPALAVGATDHLRLTVRLSDSSPSAAQSTSATLTVTVVGVQRPGRQL